MSKKQTLTSEAIVHIAQLANVSLSHTEIEKFKAQLTETLQYVENLHELDTSSVLPTNHATDLKNITFEDGTPCQRMLTQTEALANAKYKKNNYFVVKRIM